MLVLTAVVALYAMLAARRSGSLRSYTVAGAMVGATVASKWNGGALLVPLFVTIALGGLRDVGLLVRRTAAAVAAAAGVLLLLNPWLALDPDLYLRHLGSTVNQYQERLVNADSGWFDQPLSVATSLVGSVYFSPVLGVCALAGLAWLLVLALRHLRASGLAPRRRRRRDNRRRLDRAELLRRLRRRALDGHPVPETPQLADRRSRRRASPAPG